ncbi:MAG TPA: hypothetical protein P5254_16445 [Aquihabitans sp.]|nr:hypothetical protein [Aquihabitans sp.]
MGALVSNVDIAENIAVESTLLPNVRTSTTSGTTVDRLGYTRAAFVAHVGTITDGTFAFDLEESDDGSSWSNIDSGDLSTSMANATSSADDRVLTASYLGSKRYLRCNLTVTGSPSTGGPIGVAVLLAGARVSPTS